MKELKLLLTDEEHGHLQELSLLYGIPVHEYARSILRSSYRGLLTRDAPVPSEDRPTDPGTPHAKLLAFPGEEDRD
jgi:hypothetical protein